MSAGKSWYASSLNLLHTASQRHKQSTSSLAKILRSMSSESCVRQQCSAPAIQPEAADSPSSIRGSQGNELVPLPQVSTQLAMEGGAMLLGVCALTGARLAREAAEPRHRECSCPLAQQPQGCAHKRQHLRAAQALLEPESARSAARPSL